MSDLTEFDDLQLKSSDTDRGEGATHAESTSSEARASASGGTSRRPVLACRTGGCSGLSSTLN